MPSEQFDMTEQDTAAVTYQGDGLEGDGLGAPPVRETGPVARRPGRRGKGGNLLLAGLFAAGIAGVYLMSLRSGPEPASAQQKQVEAQVEAALVALSRKGGPARRFRAKAADLVNALVLDAKRRQIPVGDLGGNPFVLTHRLTSKPKTTLLKNAMSDGGRKEREDSARLWKQASEAVEKLELQAVLMGRAGAATAVITNNFLATGQKIRGWTVARIEPRKVVLTWKDKTHVLRMK